MNFSIILNSRGRPAFLTNLLESIFRKAESPSLVEVIVKLDDDDYDTLSVVPLLEMAYPNLKVITSPRPDNLHMTINKMSSISKGDFLFVINDDVIFNTENWDSIILSRALPKLKENKDNILYVGVRDTSIDKAHDGKYASFPIISRESYNALGCFMSEIFVGLGGDVFIYRIFEQVDRVLQVEEVVLDHLLHLSLEQINNPDPTNSSMRQNTYANLWRGDPWQLDISKEVGLLNEKITNSI